jgi:hypothetical protein
MISRFIAFAGPAAVAVIVAATSGCLGNPITNNAPPPADTVCERGALKAGDSLAFIFDGANGCRTVDLFSAETTFANSFKLALTSGTGYLITMGTTDSNPYLRPSLELVDTAKHLIAYDTYYWPQQAALTFVADSTVNWTVRAATEDTLAGDFGQYFIRMQQCKVPVGPLSASTDSATQSDSLAKSDCIMPKSDFNRGDSSHVHLYSMHVDAGQARTLTYNSTEPLVILIGPTYDTFASLPGSLGADSVDSPSGSLEFAPTSTADYTVVVGTYAYSAAAVPYTLTIGAEHAPSMQRMRLRQRRAHNETHMAGGTRPRCCSVR